MSEKLNGSRKPGDAPVHMVVLHGVTITFPEPFLQKHLEEWQTYLNALTRADQTNANAVYRGALVRATIQCGWVDGLTEAEILEQPPYVIEGLSAEIHFFIAATRRPPKGSP